MREKRGKIMAGVRVRKKNSSQSQDADMSPRSEQRIPQPTGSSCYLIGFTPAVERAKII
jgi:hypothetical protein